MTDFHDDKRPKKKPEPDSPETRTMAGPASASESTAGAAGEGPGSIIGPYKLLQVIGEGGFGTVFLAEQEKPVARQVALKIIKLGMDTRKVVARFEQERQALAILDHPHIARVLDAGSTETGRPYFVMDLVKGEPIAGYCDRNQLPITERLELVLQICDAVQHAHTKGIIHRDLKPSNILVTSQDGRPSVKVIDFGIAKATASKLTEMTLMTEHRALVGTPEYMSPEQAEGSLDIDTRSDVYSLGVLLYELLTGSTPFTTKQLREATYAEIQRIIRDVEPPRPSTRLSQSADSLATIAASRRIEPRRLDRLVRGELDWIVMKALEKDRGRRYGSASDLGLDIRRYLDGDAVVAAPPSAEYRVRKFIRRHRSAVGTGAAVAAALLVGVVAFAWQARIAGHERDRALAAEAETRASADELKLVADFQAEMLDQVDPTEAGRFLTEDVLARFAAALTKAGVPAGEVGRQSTVFSSQWEQVNATDAARELIDRTILRPGVAAIAQQFQDQPLVAAQLNQSLADLYRHLGLYDAARPLQSDALDTRRKLLGNEQPATLKSISHMGLLLMSMGQWDEAEPFMRESYQALQQGDGQDHREMLDSITNLAYLLENQGQPDQAEPYYREVLEKSRRLLGPNDPATFVAVNNMGSLLHTQGKLDEAEPLYREALEGNRRLLEADDSRIISGLGNLAVLLHEQGRLDEAEPFYREALAKSRRALGEDHPTTLNAIGNLGAVLKYQGRLDEAEPLYREALEKRRRLLGDEHPSTLISVNNMAGLLRDEGRTDEAEAYYREAVAGKRAALGGDHPSTLNSIISLGSLLHAQGRDAEAAILLSGALGDARQASRAGSPVQLGRLLMHLGKARTSRAKYAPAEASLLEAQGILFESRGPSHQDTRECRTALVNLYTAWNTAQPEKGYAAQARAWQAKLEAED